MRVKTVCSGTPSRAGEPQVFDVCELLRDLREDTSIARLERRGRARHAARSTHAEEAREHEDSGTARQHCELARACEIDRERYLFGMQSLLSTIRENPKLAPVAAALNEERLMLREAGSPVAPAPSAMAALPIVEERSPT